MESLARALRTAALLGIVTIKVACVIFFGATDGLAISVKLVRILSHIAAVGWSLAVRLRGLAVSQRRGDKPPTASVQDAQDQDFPQRNIHRHQTPATMSAAQDPSEVPMAQLQQPKNGPPAPSKPGNPSKNAPKGKTGAPAAADTSGESNEPSKAEAKKIAKLNKQARRAKEREEREQGLGVPAEQQQQKQKQPQQQQQQTSTGASAPAKKTGKQLEKPAVAQRRTSAAPPTAAETKKKREQLVSDNIPPMFAHLAWQSAHKASVSTAGIDIHPAVLALGLQIRDYVVCGSSARCVATLLAFKQVNMPVSTLYYTIEFG